MLLPPVLYYLQSHNYTLLIHQVGEWVLF